jgi:hypothetical protein
MLLALVPSLEEALPRLFLHGSESSHHLAKGAAECPRHVDGVKSLPLCTIPELVKNSIQQGYHENGYTNKDPNT